MVWRVSCGAHAVRRCRVHDLSLCCGVCYLALCSQLLIVSMWVHDCTWHGDYRYISSGVSSTYAMTDTCMPGLDLQNERGGVVMPIKTV